MKPFDELNIIDKAKLLHELFPDEIKGLIEFILQTANELTTNPEKVKDNWGGKQFSADAWVELARDTDRRIVRNFDALIKIKQRFSDQLFDGYTGMFTLQCMQDYLDKCKNNKFAEAIEFLFDV